eukprot:jgi/Ulvmu1/4876/UM020_0162.1
MRDRALSQHQTQWSAVDMFCPGLQAVLHMTTVHRQFESHEEDAIDALKRRISHMKAVTSDWPRSKAHRSTGCTGQATAMDVRYHANVWALTHGKMPFKAPLPKALDDRIKIWFSSIDRRSGQSLTPKDVAKALEMGGITSDKHGVMRLIQSIDLDDSGTIELHEFEVFIREVVARARLIDESTILLPSGQMLVLGDVVSNSTRQNILHDMIAGGDRRVRWAHDEGDKALEVIESQRALARMVMRHQKILKRRSSILLRPSDIANSKLQGGLSGLVSHRSSTLTRQDTFARLAAAEVLKVPVTRNHYGDRRKRFRKMLKTCVSDTRPVMESMLQTLCGNPPQCSASDKTQRSHVDSGDVTAEHHQESSFVLSLLKAQEQRPAMQAPAKDIVQDQKAVLRTFVDRHLDRIEHGLQDSADSVSCAEPHSLLLQPPICPSSSSFTFGKPGETESADIITRGSHGQQKVKLQPLSSSTLAESAPNEIDCQHTGHSVNLALAPVHTSVVRGSTSGPSRTASALISTLHDRVCQVANNKKTRNLHFQWNRHFKIAKGSDLESPWHDLAKVTTGVPQKAKLRLLRDGGLAATPLLPTMCQQDLETRRRLRPLPEHVASKHMACTWNRRHGVRPPYVSSGAATLLHA